MRYVIHQLVLWRVIDTEEDKIMGVHLSEEAAKSDADTWERLQSSNTTNNNNTTHTNKNNNRRYEPTASIQR